jgi:hypothetical protein
VILQIRATSGGGKTTLMRALYEAAGCKPLKQETMKRGGAKTLLSDGAWNGVPFYVVGPYDVEGTGGCDRIATIDQVIKLVDNVASKTQAADGVHHRAIIAFEGLLLAHSWGALGEFIHEKYGPRYINAFIDTDVKTCYKNVLARRANGPRAGNVDPERLAKIKKNVYDDYHRVELCYARVIARGGIRVDIPYRTAYESTAALLDKWSLLYAG